MRIISFLLCIALFCAYATTASADYPERLVRVVVPVAEGGGADVLARMLAQKLSERLGQQFVVENRPGGRRESSAARP